MTVLPVAILGLGPILSAILIILIILALIAIIWGRFRP